ncbi:MAG: DUF2442 domain-containing protein [Pseudomonadota bacterium]
MLQVIEAEYVEGYKIRVRFNNGACGVVDLTDALWGPVFEPLRDPEEFCRFEVSEVLHTLRWPNEADLAPEYIYEEMVKQGAADRRGEANSRPPAGP